MKTRGKALHDYLFSCGVLNGTPQEIDTAKLRYRKLYKRQWKQQKEPGKELRIGVTKQQFAAIKRKAETLQMLHTSYARNIILASIDAYPMLNREALLQLLQLISMSVNKTAHQPTLSEVHVWLQQAETLLLHHLSKR